MNCNCDAALWSRDSDLGLGKHDFKQVPVPFWHVGQNVQSLQSRYAQVRIYHDTISPSSSLVVYLLPNRIKIIVTSGISNAGLTSHREMAHFGVSYDLTSHKQHCKVIPRLFLSIFLPPNTFRLLKYLAIVKMGMMMAVNKL